MTVRDTSVQQSPRPFRVAAPQATIDRILNRVRDAQFPDRLDGNDWRYGTDWDYMKALADYWAGAYDWRKAEASLNRYPQFLARVNDYDIHFYHVKGRGPKPMPLILTHGFNLVHYTKMPRGGHFAFWEQAEAMVDDVREFFRKLRT
jgi:pimeloyl-ACP methyl ester carboxylesterase